MDEIKQQLHDRADQKPVHGSERRREESYRPEPMEMLSSNEVRRQLGWFLTSSYGGRND